MGKEKQGQWGERSSDNGERKAVTMGKENQRQWGKRSSDNEKREAMEMEEREAVTLDNGHN